MIFTLLYNINDPIRQYIAYCAELPKVKQKFYKGTASAGNGIGLSICDEIVKLHRGQLIIDSAPGQGTEVRVILPL